MHELVGKHPACEYPSFPRKRESIQPCSPKVGLRRDALDSRFRGNDAWPATRLDRVVTRLKRDCPEGEGYGGGSPTA